jgi:hypothetical protein
MGYSSGEFQGSVGKLVKEIDKIGEYRWMKAILADHATKEALVSISPTFR